MATSPAMIARCAFSRLSHSPRSTRATSRRIVFWFFTQTVLLNLKRPKKSEPLYLGCYKVEASFPHLRCDLHGNALSFAEDDNCNRLPDLGGIKGECVIVNVGNFLTAEIDQNVTALQSSLFRRTSGSNSGKFNALNLRCVIWNGAQ